MEYIAYSATKNDVKLLCKLTNTQVGVFDGTVQGHGVKDYNTFANDLLVAKDLSDMSDAHIICFCDNGIVCAVNSSFLNVLLNN